MAVLPTDKTEYTAEDTVIRQTQCKASFGYEQMVFSIRVKGVSTDIVDLGQQYRTGSTIPILTIKQNFSDDFSDINLGSIKGDGEVKSSEVTTEKGCATLNLVVGYDYKNKPDSPSGIEVERTVRWEEKTTKYQFPLEVYAGETTLGTSAAPYSDSEYADGGVYQSWLNENGTNQDNYRSFKTDINNKTISLSARTLELAQKHYNGIESVERGYPEVVRYTEYRNLPGTSGSDGWEVDARTIAEIGESPALYVIDNDTPNSVWGGKFPNFSWLKSVYDVTFSEGQYEGKFNGTVTEAWIGISKDERGEWDKNLYAPSGDGRWDFYPTTSASE